MIVVCRNCKKGYDVPIDLKTDRPKRGVKCQLCKTDVT